MKFGLRDDSMLIQNYFEIQKKLFENVKMEAIFVHNNLEHYLSRKCDIRKVRRSGSVESPTRVVSRLFFRHVQLLGSLGLNTDSSDKKLFNTCVQLQCG